MASPELLRLTASCSLEALQQIDGDPFSQSYLDEVSQCGSKALDALTISPEEFAPFVQAICARVRQCDTAPDCDKEPEGKCEMLLTQELGSHLRRAIGAINAQGRTALQACLAKAECSDLTTQVTSCMDPILNHLLWLPDD